MGRIFSIFAVIAVVVFLGSAVATPVAVYAQDAQARVCERLPGDPSDPSTLRGECERDANTSFQNTVGSVIDVLSWVVGALSVVALVIAGFMYVASAGNPDTAKKAKSTIIYAVIGLIVAFAAQIIVRFVVSWI